MEKDDTVIVVENVSKVFSKDKKSTRSRLKRILLNSFFACKKSNLMNNEEFVALDNISFTIKKNERIAILGHNGSGKSTLLKMLSGIYLPDDGKISINGHVSSILELSSGFKAELSGFDNIYFKFAMMGKDKSEVDSIIESIIAFSELEEFMDTPLKHYSSGMKSKLGFAIVTSMTPEILILDEVFAAGDKNFRAKSKVRIKELYQNTTTLLVSHNMKIVKDVAERVIVLNRGKKVFEGNVDEGISHYNSIK